MKSKIKMKIRETYYADSGKTIMITKIFISPTDQMEVGNNN